MGPSVAQSSYPAAIVVNAWDREGLLRDVSAATSQRPPSLTTDHIATIHITLHVSSSEQLSRVFARIARQG